MLQGYDTMFCSVFGTLCRSGPQFFGGICVVGTLRMVCIGAKGIWRNCDAVELRIVPIGAELSRGISNAVLSR